MNRRRKNHLWPVCKFTSNNYFIANAILDSCLHQPSQKLQMIHSAQMNSWMEIYWRIIMVRSSRKIIVQLFLHQQRATTEKVLLRRTEQETHHHLHHLKNHRHLADKFRMRRTIGLKWKKPKAVTLKYQLWHQNARDLHSHIQNQKEKILQNHHRIRKGAHLLMHYKSVLL